MPETKALMLIRDIYHEENQLKDMNSEDTTVIKKKKVEPNGDQFREDAEYYMKKIYRDSREEAR